MRFLKKQIVHKSKTNMGAEKSRGGLSPTNLSDFFACVHQSGLHRLLNLHRPYGTLQSPVRATEI